jgi:hypothetical protein
VHGRTVRAAFTLNADANRGEAPGNPVGREGDRASSRILHVRSPELVEDLRELVARRPQTRLPRRAGFDEYSSQSARKGGPVARNSGWYLTCAAALCASACRQDALEALPVLTAWVVLPVRDFQSTLTNRGAQTAGVPDAEPPIHVPARLELPLERAGALRVLSGTEVVCAATVEVDPASGKPALTAVPGQPGPPELTAAGLAVVLVPPGAPSLQPLRVELPGSPPKVQRYALQTKVVDVGAGALGHTFVHHVDVVDGHLWISQTDMAKSGLSDDRTYANGGFEQGPVGRGWTHLFGTYALADGNRQLPAGTRRYLILGASLGQTFTCTRAGCQAQRGFHSTLREEPGGIVFRAKAGFEYRLARVDLPSSTARFRLEAIVDPLGRRKEFKFEDASDPWRLTRVVASGPDQELRYVYVSGPGAPLLARVERRSLAEPARDTVVECVRYEHDERANLVALRHYAGACGATAPDATERYQYAPSPADASRDRLISATDAKGATTAFEYLDADAKIPGEQDYGRMARADDRVRRVRVGTTTVTFSYRLVPKAILIFGKQTLVWETEAVTAEGADTSGQRKTYQMNPFGEVVRGAEHHELWPDAITSDAYDAVHALKLVRAWPNGMLSRFKYDDFGDIVEERIEGPVGFAANRRETVERWGFDPGFVAQICHVDPAGKVTLTTVDSNGADPRTGPVTGTGLALSITAFATPVDAEKLASTATCAELAAAVEPSAADQLTRNTYCGVRGGACPAGSPLGELVQSRKLSRREAAPSSEDDGD